MTDQSQCNLDISIMNTEKEKLFAELVLRIQIQTVEVVSNFFWPWNSVHTRIFT
jgi:hypothetical protein